MYSVHYMILAPKTLLHMKMKMQTTDTLHVPAHSSYVRCKLQNLTGTAYTYCILRVHIHDNRYMYSHRISNNNRHRKL